jgi:hypothetical protein
MEIPATIYVDYVEMIIYYTTTSASYNVSAGSILNNDVITAGSSTFTLTGAGTVFDNSSGTFTQEDSTIKLTDSSSSGKTFAGGGQTYGNIWLAGGAGTGSFTITGSNTFADFKDDGSVAHSILFTAGITTTVTTFTVSGTAGNLITAGLASLSSITKTGSSGAGNIGSSSNFFNQVFATATTALYADLAEKYTADQFYLPGTVVSFGGTAEVTASAIVNDRKIAGVVSARPSYLMNAGLEADYTAVVALQGRVPCLVQGPVAKGDMMVSAGNGRAQACENPLTGAVIGKALENFDGDEGTIEVVVGRI